MKLFGHFGTVIWDDSLKISEIQVGRDILIHSEVIDKLAQLVRESINRYNSFPLKHHIDVIARANERESSFVWILHKK
jgi:hypothetical protein